MIHRIREYSILIRTISQIQASLCGVTAWTWMSRAIWTDDLWIKEARKLVNSIIVGMQDCM